MGTMLNWLALTGRCVRAVGGGVPLLLRIRRSRRPRCRARQTDGQQAWVMVCEAWGAQTSSVGVAGRTWTIAYMLISCCIAVRTARRGRRLKRRYKNVSGVHRVHRVRSRGCVVCGTWCVRVGAARTPWKGRSGNHSCRKLQGRGCVCVVRVVNWVWERGRRRGAMRRRAMRTQVGKNSVLWIENVVGPRASDTPVSGWAEQVGGRARGCGAVCV